MIQTTFTEGFSQEWIDKNITDPTNDLVILRKIIPWEILVLKLSKFYSGTKGRFGKPIRVVVAVFILSKLRLLSDEDVIKQIRENRYFQYFCNVPDDKLSHFLDSSTLCTLRGRYGEEGFEIIEHHVFENFRKAGVIDSTYALIDTSVLESNIAYPTDVSLVYKALCKMSLFAKNNNLEPWWPHDEVKARWRNFNLNKQKNPWDYLFEFSEVLKHALPGLEFCIKSLQASEKVKNRAAQLLDNLTLLDHQNILKIKGEKHIENRIVSLDELDARPIKKGKKHPKCEFGTTVQSTFNRQGFMITVENFIGKPNDKTLYPKALELFYKKVKQYPKICVTDLGYRSRANFTFSKGKVETVFLGRSDDVSEDQQKHCQKARSATEGFIAISKHRRGMKRSYYKGFLGDRVWSLLCQTAYNLKKFLQLYQNETLGEKSIMALGLLG